MKYTTDITSFGQYDVVVVGGGTAGCTAALGAARNGAKTLILERLQVLGGNMSSALVYSVHGYRSDKHYGKSSSPTCNWSSPLCVSKSSITMEIYDRVRLGGGTAFPDHVSDPSLRENMDEVAVINVLDDMMKEAGVKVLFNTFVFDVIKECNKVTGVVFTNKSGTQYVEAKVVIDCSADADLAAKAGVDYLYGETDGRAHGISMAMQLGGIDVDRFLEYLENRPEPTEEEKEQLKQDTMMLLNGGEPSPKTIVSFDGTETGEFHMAGRRSGKMTPDEQRQLRKEGKFMIFSGSVNAEWIQYVKEHPEIPHMPNTITKLPTYPKPPLMTYFGLIRDGKIRYDQTLMGIFEMVINCTNEEEISETIITGRKMNKYVADFYKEKIPGFENSYILKMANYGSRESRQIIGEYVVKCKDMAYGAEFDDAIAWVWRANNRHFLTGQQGIRIWFEPDYPFTYPYSCLVPKTVDGMLVAGRSISKEVMLRVCSMVPCMQVGEAAGIGAAIAVRDNVAVRNVSVKEIQEKVHLDEARSYLEDYINPDGKKKSIED